MNLTELARKLKVGSEELKEKLPGLGFDIGRKAIKINPKVAEQITRAWVEMKRREEVQKQYAEQQEKAERKRQREAGIIPTKTVELPNVVTVREFAGKLEMPVTDIIKVLMKSGILASVNERIDFDTATILAEDLGFAVKKMEAKTDETVNLALDQMKESIEADIAKKPRAPVVVIMGHVDHGKTTLLDTIRKTDVAGGEAGGITQHIGAYQIVKKNHPITFIDTPGHEAFTVMRSRGAKVADIAILVVAADDSVQPQTKEAISIIQAAKLPMIVAINKIDKPDANIEKTKTQLSENNVLLEGWGGNVPVVAISAKKGLNIDQMLDMILLVADVEKEKIMANPDRRAIGTVIESHVDKGEGPVATVLVQAGTLHATEPLGIRGVLYGKVRAMKNWKGELVREAPPGMPVKILGFKVAPAVGDVMEVPENVKDLESSKSVQSRNVIEGLSAERTAQSSDEAQAKQSLNIVLRTDVLGSLEAIVGKLEKIKDEDIAVKIVGKGLGNVTDGDIEAAATAGAVVYGFNVQATHEAQTLARDKGVPLVTKKIIYELFDDVQARLNQIVAPTVIITENGSLEVLAIFKKDKEGQVVGAVVRRGKVLSKGQVRVFRGGQIIGEGEIVKLQSGKQQVTECRQSEECGLQIKTKTPIEIGDTLEAFLEEKKIKKIEVK